MLSVSPPPANRNRLARDASRRPRRDVLARPHPPKAVIRIGPRAAELRFRDASRRHCRACPPARRRPGFEWYSNRPTGRGTAGLRRCPVSHACPAAMVLQLTPIPLPPCPAFALHERGVIAWPKKRDMLGVRRQPARCYIYIYIYSILVICLAQ